MKIAITHLTRMQRGYFCVAGVNVENGTHVRPVQSNARLRNTLCARRGGPFDMATVVDLGATRPVASPPEVEDHEFTPYSARAEQTIEPALFWEMLGFLARPTLHELFGPALHQAGHDRAIVEPASGDASLGCLMPSGQPSLIAEERPGRSPSLRLHFTDGCMALNLSVTDLRLWADDHATPPWDRVQNVGNRLNRGVPCLLSVGLTRPFASRADEQPVHWLQVNNIHLADEPCWRLGDDSSTGNRPWAASVRTSYRRDPYRWEDDSVDLEDLPF